MSTFSSFPLDLIDANPYQPRIQDDPEHVQKVAQSIADQGLLQIPVGRPAGERVQLAFGHTRHLAYKLLKAQGASGYDTLPVTIRPLSDEEMFTLAISENLARKDLTPIEEARAMRRYRDEFGKTSAEIGRLFNLSESAVRGKMRLLDLPEGAQEKLGAGEISEGTARKLLTLQAAAPDQVDAMAEKLTTGGYETPDKVSEEIRDTLRRNVYYMSGQWGRKDDQARAGTGLWPLTWDCGALPAPTFKIFSQAYTQRLHKDAYPELKRDWEQASFEIITHGVTSAKTLVDAGVPEDVAGLALHLIRPPACSGCEFHTALDGSHYCSIKTCWERKRPAWYRAELERVSQELGIKPYSKEEDGKDYDELRSYNSEDKKTFKARPDTLRLKISYQEYNQNDFTKSHCVTVISVSDEAKAIKARERERMANQEIENQTREERWKIEQVNREASERFLCEVATPMFAFVLAPLSGTGLLEMMAAVHSRDSLEEYRKSLPEKPAERILALRRDIIHSYLNSWTGWKLREAGVLAVAEHLAGVAKQIGLALPEDWLEVARKFDPNHQPVEEPEYVEVETPA